MATGEFTHSFALFDADSRLVDWDEGFENEWLFAVPALKRGVTYPDLLRAALSDPIARQFMEVNYHESDLETVIRSRVKSFGNDRSWDYTMLGTRVVHVDERRTALGGIRRLARDITEERQAETALVEAQQRLEAADSETGAVFTETRGSYVFEPVSEGLRRLLSLPADVVGQDAMAFYSRMITTPEEDAERAGLMERAVESLDICSFEYRVRDGQDVIRWIRQSMLPRREPDGSIVFSGVMRDITREKEAEYEIEMLRSVVIRSSDSISIFESMPVGSSRESRIVYVNQKFTDLFGWSMD